MFLLFSWTTLIIKNFEIEKECLKLQKEIDYLQSQTKERVQLFITILIDINVLL